MKILKTIYKFIASMRFAIILLVIFAVACMIGSLVPQGEMFELYRDTYSERTAALILAFRLDDVFHSWWFLALTGLLCLCLLLCNLSRLGSLIRRTRNASDAAHAVKEPPSVFESGVENPALVWKRLHFQKPVETSVDERTVLFGCRNRFGYWGAWICHLGILLIVVGYALGQMTLFSASVYGTPGQTKAIENTSYTVTIDAFRTERSETGFAEQYVASLTVRDTESGSTQSGTASVNHPAVLQGMKFYQNSTGYAVRVSIAEDGTPIDSADLCVGEELTISFLPGLSLYLDAFEPDHSGMGSPAYHILFFYQGQHLDAGKTYFAPGGVIDLGQYTITLSDPMEYTLLRVKKDSFAWMVLLGAILSSLGLFIALYAVPEQLWAEQDADGTWTVHGNSRKLAPLFKEQFERAVHGKPARGGKEAER